MVRSRSGDAVSPWSPNIGQSAFFMTSSRACYYEGRASAVSSTARSHEETAYSDSMHACTAFLKTIQILTANWQQCRQTVSNYGERQVAFLKWHQHAKAAEGSDAMTLEIKGALESRMKLCSTLAAKSFGMKQAYVRPAGCQIH